MAVRLYMLGALSFLLVGIPTLTVAKTAEVLSGKAGASSRLGSGWLNLNRPRDFKRGDKLRLRIGGTATKIKVRLLPKGQSPDSTAGLLQGIIAVPKNRTVEVKIQRDRPRIVQISVHGGANPWGKYALGRRNGAATLIKAVLTGRSIPAAKRASRPPAAKNGRRSTPTVKPAPPPPVAKSRRPSIPAAKPAPLPPVAKNGRRSTPTAKPAPPPPAAKNGGPSIPAAKPAPPATVPRIGGRSPPAPRVAPSPPAARNGGSQPPGGGAPPSNDPFATVDQILAKLELGNIAFNVPHEINLHDTAIIQLLLGFEKSVGELKEMIEAAGGKAGASIRVSDRMEARLSGPNFAITAVTPELQAVSRIDVTEWKWEVKPESEGRQHLHLTLSVLMNIDGSATRRAIRSFDREIEVQVTWDRKVVSFIKSEYQWLWAVILAPVAGWFWNRRRRSKPDANGSAS